MKRFICAAFAAALLVPGTWAVSARAHDDGAEGGSGGPPRHEMAEKLQKKLGLTDEQAAKFKDAAKAHGEAMKALGPQMREDLKKLREQVKAKASDAEISATLASLRASRKAAADAQQKFHDGLASFLTPTQQAKMVLGMAERMREGRRGRWGGKRGGEKEDKDDDGK